MITKLGSTGDLVVKLQKALGLTPDGDFGPKTELALKIWQKRMGLIPDGIAGPVTFAKIDAVENAGPPAFKEYPGILPFDNLRTLIPDHVLEQLPDTVVKFNITTVLRLAHFLAQCALESRNFSITVENLSYSANRLKQVFPKYFLGNMADLYAYQPIKIGSRVYANRLGNGDEKSREGYTFRGRGYIQLTGKINYTMFSKFIGVNCVENPDLIATTYPLKSAAYFFNSNDLWTICDKGATDKVVTLVTKRVNGGTNGLTERIAYFHKFYAALTK